MDFIKNNKTLEKQEILNNYKNMASKLHGVWAVKLNTQIKKLEDEISEENNIIIKINNSNNVNNIINIKEDKKEDIQEYKKEDKQEDKKEDKKEDKEEDEEDGDWIKVIYKCKS